MTQQSILTVPWVSLEDAQVHQVDADAPTVATPAPVITTEEDTNNGGRRWFWLFIGLSVAWVFVVAAMLLTGAMFPIEGNAAAYLVLMTGLILAALVALTCPRADGDEEFVTLGLYTVAQCTPSRANTLTGRGSS